MVGGLYVYTHHNFNENGETTIQLGRNRHNVDLMFLTWEEAMPTLSQFPEFTLFRETTELSQVTLTPTQKRQDRYS